MRVNTEWRVYAKENGIELCPKNYNKWRRATRKGRRDYWLTKTYGRIKRDMKTKFGLELDFSKQELGDWADARGLACLLKNYMMSGYQKDLNPSVDRIDDFRGYVFDNMQLVTWAENNARGRASEKNKNQCRHMAIRVWSKPVVQVDEKGFHIATFSSVHAIERMLGLDSSLIARACRKGVLGKGYYWHYA